MVMVVIGLVVVVVMVMVMIVVGGSTKIHRDNNVKRNNYLLRSGGGCSLYSLLFGLYLLLLG